jgi:hypothetical protein
LSCLCGAPSLTRGRVRVILRPTVSQYVLVSSQLCGRLTRYCFLFKRFHLEFVVLSMWGALSDERRGLHSQSHFMADSQYALVSSPLCGRLTRYCFLFKSLGLEFVVLPLWSALSDERPGLHSQSHFMADSQYALVSSPLCGRLSRYCFLFKSLGLEFVVLSLWSALSDERLGQLSIVKFLLSLFIFSFPPHFTRHTFYVYTIYADHAPSSFPSLYVTS